MIVVGKDTLANGAFLTIFDCKNDKFVANPVLYKGEDYDNE